MIDPAVLETVSLPLAIEDAVPVLLSTAGFVVIARGIGLRRGKDAGAVALIAAACIGIGGSAKVAWKLIAAGAEQDVQWLAELLFPFLALGFVAMAILLVSARRREGDGGSEVSLARRSLAGLFVAIAGFGVLTSLETTASASMPLAIVASLAVSGMLIAIAWHSGDHPAAWMLVANVIVTLGLAGLAAVDEQTMALQWIEQSANTVSQALFLAAAIRVSAPGVRWWRTTSPPPQPMPVP